VAFGFCTAPTNPGADCRDPDDADSPDLVVPAANKWFSELDRAVPNYQKDDQ
jgi:hypothetical protein